MAPGIPNDNSGLGWSKYAPPGQDQQNSNAKPDLNQRTAETIARQADIDARLSKLRSRRDPTTEKRDEEHRQHLMAAQKAAAEEHARLKAKKKAEEEAAYLEAERREVEKKDLERIERERQEAERLRREEEEAERLKREQEEAERLKREQEEAERIRREQEEAERIKREQEEAKRLEAERIEADRIKKEKEDAAEAALRAMLLEKVDQMEEDGLTKTQARQLDLQKNIEEATIRHQDVLVKINGKESQLNEAQETLERIQKEYQELKDTESTINAQIDAGNKKCFELQNESEMVMERAANMRKKVEDKSIRSIDMLDALHAPDSDDQAHQHAEDVPQYGKTVFGNNSPAKSTEVSMEGTEVLSEAAADLKSTEVNLGDNGDDEDSIQAKQMDSKPAATKENGVENFGTKKAPAHRKEASDVKNLENQLKFEEWPIQEARPFGGKLSSRQFALIPTDIFTGAQKRLVKVTNLPITSTVASIQALIWGGRIEKIDYSPGNSFAWVLFMRGEDCEKYFTATANGINYPDDPNRVVWVEMGDPVTVNEKLRGFYDAGHTRCVRAVGADEDWGQMTLTKLASAKNRKLERIVNGANPKGVSSPDV